MGYEYPSILQRKKNNEENNNTLWNDAILLDMNNILVAFD